MTSFIRQSFFYCIIISFIIQNYIFAVSYVDYEVENGDTLYGIAFAHDMKASEFLKLNKIDDPDGYKLKVGEKLKVKEKGYDLVYDANNKSYGLKPEKNKSYRDYKVKEGDTVLGIAFSHNMTASEFCTINNIDDFNKYQLKIGEILKVVNISKEEKINNSNVEAIKKEINKNDYIEYKVQSGDTLYGIAFSHNMTANEFLKLNKIDDPNKYKLYVGKILYVKNIENKNNSNNNEEEKIERIEDKENIEFNIDTEKNADNNVITYTVQNGDTLYGIAFENDMSVSEFLRLNNISDPIAYKLQVGEKLKINSKSDKMNASKTTKIYRVKSGDTLGAIAIKNSMSLDELLKLNSLKKDYVLKIGDNIKVYDNIAISLDNNSIKKASYIKIESYKVKSGDTLSQIAVDRKMDLVELYSLNGLSDKYVLKAGDILKVHGEREKINTVVTSTYVVKRGDTLYSIAKNNKMDLKKLLEINNIEDANKYSLQIGANLKIQTIKTTYESYEDTLPESSFQWPYRGIIVARYGVDTYKLANRGINILGSVGDKVLSADYGIVEYADDIRGFGKVIIIKHKNGFTTSYAHLSKIAVKLGDIVNKGEYIGNIGDSGLVDKSELYFKISFQGRAIDPIKLLPKG